MDFCAAIFLTVTADTALLSDDRELRRLVRDPLRSTSTDEAAVGYREMVVVTGVDVGLGVVVRIELERLTATGEFVLFEGLSKSRLEGVRRPIDAAVAFRLDTSLVVVTVESDEGVRTVGVVVDVTSLHDDSLSLPCDGVSDTRLWVSSKPSSFSSGCVVLVCLMISRGGLQMRSGVSAGDLRFRFASRTSSGLIELSLRPTMPIRAMTRCLVGSIVVGDVFVDVGSLVHRSEGSLVVSVVSTLVVLGRSFVSSSVVASVVRLCRSVLRAVACRSK